MAKPNLTAHEVRQALSYDPETGILSWRGRLEGKPAGYRRPDGYLDVRIKNALFRGHRLIWLYMTGEWPDVWVDHIDRDPTNNRWSNLRAATISQNHQNQKVRKDSKIGLRGVERHSQSGGFVAKLVVNGKKIHLGLFRTKEEAFAARLAGERVHFSHSTVLHTQSAYPDAYVLPGAIGSGFLESS